VTTRSDRNDQLADAYLAAVLHRDPEAMLLMLIEVSRAGGTRNLLDFFGAVGAAARDLLEQLGADQAEDLLRRRLLAAAIHDAQPLTEMEKTVATAPTKALTERRQQLQTQLTALRSQHVDAERDVQLADEDWRNDLADGQDVGLIAERRRHRQSELDEMGRQIEQVTAWIGEVDTEIQRLVPHQALDADLAQLTADLQAYDEYRAQLNGAHQAAIGKVLGVAEDLHELVSTSRQRHDELDIRARNLRNTAARLDRPDVAVPAPGSWSQPVEQALHGTGAPWRTYLVSVQQRSVEPLARALGEAAAVNLAGRSQAAAAADRASRHHQTTR
jgi:hypothetical protein